MAERIAELANIMEHLAPHEVFYLGPLRVTTTVVNTWIVMAIMFGVIFVLTKGAKLIPKGKQNVPEMFLEFIYGLIDGIIGKEGRKYVPLIGTLFIFILFLNLSWFIPEMKPPTMDLSTTLAFGLVTIVCVQLIGIKKKGLINYIKHFFQPFPLLAPLNIIEEIVKPFSLGLRLYGNMFGEEMVVAILFTLIPLFTPIPIQTLGVLMAAIQAFVFTLLTTMYIGSIMHGH